jgi:WD40 repeat protein/phage baseplate assembly protein W
MSSKDQGKDLYIIDEQHPYPGLFPFREKDKDYFFGRDREIQELTQLIEDNVLTVVFGKSGMGKTSLLQAGLIPWIRENYYLPIYIRVNFDEQAIPPLCQVKDTIQSKIKEMDPQAPSIEDKTLWEYFSFTKILNGIVSPLLVFDQFEEIFTSSGKNSPEVDAFVTEITDLIENQVPETVRERYQKEGKPLTFPGQELNIRVIFSLREEYLPQLETFSFYLPSVKLSRYRILHMKGEDAVKAVLEPAKKIISDRGVAEEIIKKIPPAKDADYNPYEADTELWNIRKIEPFLLSLFCYRVNEKRLKNKEKVISLELIRDMSTEEIIRDYYEESMADMPAQVKNAVEDLLLTPQGYRKLQEMNSFLKESVYGVTNEHIEKLVNRRILRIEPRSGVDYVELIHDVLASILKENRDKRKEIEAAQKNKKKWLIIVITALVIVILEVLISINLALQSKIESEKKLASFQKQKASEEKQRAEKEKQKRLAYEWAAYSIDLQKRDRDLSFRLAEQACNQEKDNPVSRRALLSVFYEGGFYRELLGNKESEFSQTASEKSDFFAAFYPDGKRILTVTSKKAILWNWDGQKIEKDRESSLSGNMEFRPNADFSPDGNAIIFCSKDSRRVVLWDLASTTLKPLAFQWDIGFVAFSPDKGNITFITACRDYNIRWFDLTGKLLKTFIGHRDEVISALFSRDGKYIISTAWDNTVRIWDLNGTVIAINDKDTGIKTAAFSPDGQRVVTGSADGTVKFWDFNLKQFQTLGKHEDAVTSAVFSPNGQYILTGGNDRTVLLSTLNNFLVMEFKEWKDVIRTASFSPDGKYILIAPASGPAELRPIDPGTIIDIVNDKGKVRPLTSNDRLSYNLPQT